MAVPWLQIVQLVPSILNVSRELMKRTQRGAPAASAQPVAPSDLPARIAALEENERRQAQLVNQMAEQLAALARAVTELHRRVLWLSGLSVLALIVAIVAIVTR